MNGKVAKAIRKEHFYDGMNSTAKSYYRGSNGMILADRGRRIYQMRKEQYYAKRHSS